MDKKRLTSKKVYDLIRRPTFYEYENRTEDMARLVKCYHPEVEQHFNSDQEPHFLITTNFVSDNIGGINCELLRHHNKWLITDFGNCNFAFGSHSVKDTSKPTELRHFNRHIKDIANDLHVKYSPHNQTYYISFNELFNLQKAFYNMINFEMVYTSIMSFIA